MLLKKILVKINKWLFLRPIDKLNVFMTIYINLFCLPLKDAIKFPILIYGKCSIYQITGKIFFKCPIKKGIVLIGQSDAVRSLDGTTVLNILGNIEIEGPINFRRGLHLQVFTDAKLFLGSNVFISDNTTIVCSKEISILSNSRIGNNCTIMDTDFHYVINTTSKEVHAASKPILIGKNNWIAGLNVVKKGAKTPTGTIVAGPYSMIGKNYLNTIKEYSIIGGCPAKLIAENYRRIFNWETQKKLHTHFKHNDNVYTFPEESNIENICN